MSTFQAYRVFEDDGTVRGRVVDATLDELSRRRRRHRGGVFERQLQGRARRRPVRGKIIRRFPLIPGIDVSGTVESSGDARFRAGDPVLVTGYDLGVAHDGGYAQYVRVPADWVVPIPQGLSALDVMAIGTAGFTAAMSIVELERNGLTTRSAVP